MAKFFTKWKNQNKWKEQRDYHWQYDDDEPNYIWLKKIVLAAATFILVYMSSISDTSVGNMVRDGVKYMLTAETDFTYIADKLAPYAPQGLDVSVLKRVQNTVTKPADPLMYMTRPVEGKVLSSFGWRTHPILKQEMMHEGLDFEAAVGTSVKATAPGKIKTVTDSAQLGKIVIIEHSQDVETLYGHLGEIIVKQGELVSQGQIIAKSGKTGMISEPLVYFELRDKGKPIDPTIRLRIEPTVTTAK